MLNCVYFQRGAFVSEPAILVRRLNAGSQVWSMEKLENKLIDMREMYQEYKERCLAGLVSITHHRFCCASIIPSIRLI